MAGFIFIVQGEGRGHMSQALAMDQFLGKHGHIVEAVYIGTSPFREIPDYFLEAGWTSLRTFRSPNFVRKKNGKGINLLGSLGFNARKSLTYLREIRRIVREIDRMEPDYVINFYDLIGSFVIRRLSGAVTTIAVGHHFYLTHGNFSLPPGIPVQRVLLKILNRVMRKGCSRVAALSFREGRDEGRVMVIPPLIREEIGRLYRHPGNRDLIYLLNPGFMSDFRTMASRDTALRADLFSDAKPVQELLPGITVYRPGDTKFLEKMQSCRRLITTAGFDLIAEAAMHSIPVIAVPSENHYEQRCNALDMQRSGFGAVAGTFRQAVMMQDVHFQNHDYQDWLKQSERLLLKLIEK